MLLPDILQGIHSMYFVCMSLFNFGHQKGRPAWFILLIAGCLLSTNIITVCLRVLQFCHRRILLRTSLKGSFCSYCIHLVFVRGSSFQAYQCFQQFFVVGDFSSDFSQVRRTFLFHLTHCLFQIPFFIKLYFTSCSQLNVSHTP